MPLKLRKIQIFCSSRSFSCLPSIYVYSSYVLIFSHEDIVLYILFNREQYQEFQVTEVEIAYNISKLMKLDQRRPVFSCLNFIMSNTQFRLHMRTFYLIWAKNLNELFWCNFFVVCRYCIVAKFFAFLSSSPEPPSRFQLNLVQSITE